MVAKKKTVLKEKKEEEVKTPEVEKKVIVEEVSPAEETVESENPLEEEIPSEKSNRKLFMAGLIVVLFIFGVTGWVFYFANRYSEETTQEEITLEEGATEEPTATPASTQLEREEITLEILNGSGVAGAAGDAAEVFEALGYEDVEVGNADDTEGNELYVSSDIEDLIDVLLEDVEEELDISSISGELDDSTASARIILGE